MAKRTGRRRTAPPRTRAPAERSLLDAIAEGELDDHLGAIAAAVEARRQLLHTIDSGSGVITVTCTGSGFRKAIEFRDDNSIVVEWRWEPAGQSDGDAVFTTELSLAAEVQLDGDWTERIEYPIETVAKSESGFDRTLQGNAVVLCWPATAGAARLAIRR